MNISGSNLSESIYSMDNTYTPADNTHHNNSNNKKDGRNDCYYNGPPPVVLTSHKPYMGLGARLSQIWINPHTIFLILIIVKITSLFRPLTHYSMQQSSLLKITVELPKNSILCTWVSSRSGLRGYHHVWKGVHYGITGLCHLSTCCYRYFKRLRTLCYPLWLERMPAC